MVEVQDETRTVGRRETVDPDPAPPAAPVALPVPAAPCPSCDGAGYRRMHTGARLGDWVTVSCRSCRSQRAAA